MTITAQRPFEIGYFPEGDFRWRVSRRGSVREAGGRVTTNILVRNLDLDVEDPGDARRLEVVVVGLPLHGGSQLAVDTTLVSPLPGRRVRESRGWQTTKGTTISRTGRTACSSATCCAGCGGGGGAGGLLRRRISCPSWRKPKPKTRIGSSDEERKWLGGLVGRLSWRAQLRGRVASSFLELPKHQEQMEKTPALPEVERDLARFLRVALELCALVGLLVWRFCSFHSTSSQNKKRSRS